MKKIFLFTLVLLNTKAFSLETVFLGGGGEPTGDKTIFDGSIKSLATVKDLLKMKLNISFDGGHTETQKLLDGTLKEKNIPFTKKNYEQILASYKEKIKNGTIKSGEKLLVIINTHGAEKNNDLISHSISTSDSFSVTLDQMKALTNLAKEKGIKLAILDFSCHSGNSIALANENTCVISGSGPNHYAYTVYASKFIKEMRPGKSLEEVFLNTRVVNNLPSFPMISTDVGIRVNNEEYSVLSPYLNFKDDLNGVVTDKLSPYLESLLEGNNICKRDQDFNYLTKQVEDFQKISGVLTISNIGQDSLLENLNAYKKIQDHYVEQLINMEIPLLNNSVKISYGTPAQEEIVTWKEILNVYPTSNVKFLEQMIPKVKTKKDKEKLMAVIEKFKKIDSARDSITKLHPRLLKYKDNYKNLVQANEELFLRAQRIAEQANKMYDYRYRLERKQEKVKKSEPCRDFVL